MSAQEEEVFVRAVSAAEASEEAARRLRDLGSNPIIIGAWIEDPEPTPAYSTRALPRSLWRVRYREGI